MNQQQAMKHQGKPYISEVFARFHNGSNDKMYMVRAVKGSHDRLFTDERKMMAWVNS